MPGRNGCEAKGAVQAAYFRMDRTTQRHQIKQEDADLEDAHPGVVKSVELLPRESEPFAMKALKPIVREHEDQEPDQQESRSR